MRFIFLMIITIVLVFADGGIHLERFYIKDQNRDLSIKKILNHTRETQWKSLTKHNEAFRETHSRIWVKLLFSNTSKLQTKVIELPNLYRGKVFLYDSNGTLIHKYGHNLPFHAMSFFYPNISIPLTTLHGKSIYYLAVTSEHELNLKMNVWGKNIFKQHISAMLIFFGAYFSGMLLLLFYNSIFYIFSKENVFLYYVLYSLNIVIAMFFATGFGFMVIWPNYPQINQFSGITFYFLTLIFGLVFSREFLHTKKFLGKADKIMLYTIYLGIIFTFLSYAVTVKTKILLILFYNFTSFIMMIGAALYIAIVFRERGARLVVLGWSALIIGISVSILGYLQIIEGDFWTHIGAEIGTFLEITLFSIALASRYKDKQVALIKSQNELTEINENLEQIVKQKTHDIINTNEELKQEVNLNNQLLKELVHRVKNNLQVILSFFSLQIKSSSNPELIGMLEESRRRVHAISAVHEHLTTTRQFEQISMYAYFRELLEQNTKIFKQLDLDITIDSKGIFLPIETATLIGLIVNEIFNNACKHAYADINEPKFSVKLTQETKNTCILIVSDNGCGLCDSDEDSLGMNIIKALIKQLHGSYEIIQNNGVIYKIRFNIAK